MTDPKPPVDNEEQDAALPEPDLPQHEEIDVRNDEVPTDDD